MSKIYDGGPAFPVDYLESEKKDKGFRYRRGGGITLRDYFAAHAPVDFQMALQVFGAQDINLTDDETRAAFFAIWAMLRTEYADAMIAARSKNP